MTFSFGKIMRKAAAADLIWINGSSQAAIALLVVAVVGLNACAGRRSDVVIDPAGVDMARYQQDLRECEEISQQVRGRAAGGAVGGAVVGGAIGGILRNRGYSVLN